MLQIKDHLTKRKFTLLQFLPELWHDYLKNENCYWREIGEDIFGENKEGKVI